MLAPAFREDMPPSESRPLLLSSFADAGVGAVDKTCGSVKTRFRSVGGDTASRLLLARLAMGATPSDLGGMVALMVRPSYSPPATGSHSLEPTRWRLRP